MAENSPGVGAEDLLAASALLVGDGGNPIEGGCDGALFVPKRDALVSVLVGEASPSNAKKSSANPVS